MRLPEIFYYNDNVVDIARQLLGKFLCTYIDGKFTAGMISETEAYRVADDQASHAYKNRRTKRTEVMFQTGGVSLCLSVLWHSHAVKCRKPAQKMSRMLY